MSGPAPGARGGTPAEARAGRWFVAPALGVLTLFFLLPSVAALLLSVTDFDLYALADLDNLRFVGFDNYRHLLQEPRFWRALANTLVFAFVGGAATIAVALGGALALHSQLVKVPGLLRTAFFAPVIMTLVALAVVWRYLFQPRFGLLNQGLDWLGLPQVDFLGDPRFALASLILMAVWKNFGFPLVLFVAALRNVPVSLHEAAALDGAGPWQRFRHITLPELRPALAFVTTLTLVGYLQVFAEPFVMTREGGPAGATETVVLLMFKEGFRFWRMGYGAALAFVLFVIVLALTRLPRWLRLEGER